MARTRKIHIDRIEILKDYQQGLSIKGISEKHNTTPVTVTKVIRDWRGDKFGFSKGDLAWMLNNYDVERQEEIRKLRDEINELEKRLRDLESDG